MHDQATLWSLLRGFPAVQQTRSHLWRFGPLWQRMALSASGPSHRCIELRGLLTYRQKTREYAGPDTLAHQAHGHHKRARKNDSIDATQNALTHHTNEKKIQKDRETKRRDQRRKNTNDLGSTGDESEDGQSSISLTTTRTATYHLRTIPTRKLTQQ